MKETQSKLLSLLNSPIRITQPGYVYLKRWLADKEADTFPSYANHYLGVAGFVVDQESDEMLVIQERFAPKPIWKLPGGTADSGEDLHQVARREGSSLVVHAVALPSDNCSSCIVTSSFERLTFARY